MTGQMYDPTYMKCLEQANSETESRVEGVGEKRGKGSYYLIGIEFLFGIMQKSYKWTVVINVLWL